MSTSPFPDPVLVSSASTAVEKPCRPVEATTANLVLSVRGPLLTVRSGDKLIVLL